MGDNGTRLREERRVVVTGMGAITPLGNDVAAFWEGLMAGRSGIGRRPGDTVRVELGPLAPRDQRVALQ